MTFIGVKTSTPSGKPSLVPAVVYMAAEFESVPEKMRTAEEAAHVQRCGELNWRVRGLEFYKHDLGDGKTGFDLVSCCCKTPVSDVPGEPDQMVRCASCGRDHGLAKYVEALGNWIVVEEQREKRPLNRHARRRAERELARL